MRGQSTPGASFECRTGLAGIECGGGGKFGAGFSRLVLAGEKQAQREVRLKGFGIGCDGAAVESGGVVQPILRVGNVAGIEESARVGGMGGKHGSSLASAVFQSELAMADSAAAT